MSSDAAAGVSSTRRSVLGDIRRDAHYAARSLRRNPGFTLIAVATLALGIGASTAMFSVLDGVLLRRLPMRDQNHLVAIWLNAGAGGRDHWPIDYQDLSAFRQATHTFQSVAGVNFQGASQVVMLYAGRPVTLDASWVTGNFFTVLGVEPALGRNIGPSDDAPGAAPVMVISYAFWQRQFGGDPAALGRTLTWDNKAYTVVGVLPRGFEYPKNAQAWFAVLPWFPGTADAAAQSPAIQFDLVGRVRTGAGVRDVRAEYQAFLRSTDQQRPAAERGRRPVVTPLPSVIMGGAAPIVWAASFAVGLLLLIACINVTNLLLIRGVARGRELAIRIALGAGRRRLIRQGLIETGVLSVAGGGLGVLLAAIAVRVLVAAAPADLPRRDDIGIEPTVLAFALAITVLAAALAGLIPALATGGRHLGASLHGARNTSSGSRRTEALRHGLVVGQVSLAFVVAVGAGLLMRSLIALEDVNMGFNPERLLVLEAALPPNVVPNGSRSAALDKAILERIGAIPGVLSAAAMPKPPFSAQGGWLAPFTGEGQTAETQASNPLVNFEVVSPGYFHTLEIPVLRGRAFSDQDRAGTPRVAIISGTLAQHAWPGENAIGKRVQIDTGWATIVGVVGETRYHNLTKVEPSLYIPTGQFDLPITTLAVRTRMDPAEVMPEIRQALHDVNPALILAGGGPMSQWLAAPLARPRFSTSLLAVFAAITVLLAVVGIYGALAAMVGQRTREIGIRLAIGAGVDQVRTMVLGQGMRLALFGCAVGLVVALLGTRVLRSMLFGITPADPVTFATITSLVLLAAALACYLPARRATRVDPLVTLRAE